MSGQVRGRSRVELVVDEIQDRIGSRTLASGAKLPSIRKTAAAMGVANSTVVEAYDRLAANGIIRARRGSGFYVAGHFPSLALAEIAPPS